MFTKVESLGIHYFFFEPPNTLRKILFCSFSFSSAAFLWASIFSTISLTRLVAEPTCEAGVPDPNPWEEVAEDEAAHPGLEEAH
jgi:hypothetical protein